MPKNLKIVFEIFILGALLGMGTVLPRLVMLKFDFGLFQSVAHLLLTLALIWGFQGRSRVALWVARLLLSCGLIFGFMMCLTMGVDSLLYSIQIGGPYVQLVLILPVVLILYAYMLWVLFTKPVKEYFVAQ